jgi:LmbE family N-acetylglucosaminyl deacetylase
MIEFFADKQTARTVLLLGAHCDDIEIGCGGTVARMARAWPNAKFVWVTLSSDAVRAAETRAAATRLLGEVVDRTVLVEAFKGSCFPYCGAELKDYFESLKQHHPDLVLTHCRDDLHQDHRIVNQLTWNTFRDHAILEYEIPKYDGDIGRPNGYMALSKDDLALKCSVLLDCFPSQHTKPWFTASTFEAIARLRGIECNAPEGFAEAFYLRKLRFGLPAHSTR